MKILVISLAGIGDTILATPFIRELRANYPDAQIDALVMWAGSKDILEGNPCLNTIHQRNFIRESKVGNLRFLSRLRREGYDISINTHPQSRVHYRISARLIGAPLRLSHLYECSGLLDRFLVNRTLPQDYGKHSIDNNFDLLGLLGKKPVLARHELEIVLSPAEHEWAESFLASHSLGQVPRLGVHIGSGGTKNLSFKRWPLEHYIELLKRVRKTWPDLAILLFGGPEEEEALKVLVAQHNSPRVLRVPSRTLREAGALMHRCTAFLSVDTALMHVAAAVKAPHQIVIEAFTLNKTNEPYGNPYVLVPNPAIGGRNLEYYRYDGRAIQGTPEELVQCMASVKVEAVFEKLREALGTGVQVGA
jgi:ADP-heptose:LPS heptosyltransferase